MTIISSTHCHQATQTDAPACCTTNNDPSAPSPQEEIWLQRIDIICRVAIGVFCAVVAPIPFAISVGIGFAAGCAYAITRLVQKQPIFPHGQSKPVCAQGYMEFLSGMRFPPVLSTLATTAFVAAHTRCDPQFYTPFCGLFIGFWIGRESAVLGHTLSGRLFKPTPPKTAPCCHAAI